MGRLPRHLILLCALLGLAGCILFTDPINEAPVVTVHAPSTAVTRDSPASFTATVKDEDSPSSLTLNWYVIPAKSGGCNLLTRDDRKDSMAGSGGALASDAPFNYVPDTLDTVCVCALATDHYGALGFNCVATTPAYPPIVATIVDKSSTPYASGDLRPRCSPVHLATDWIASSDDTVQLHWTVLDPTGKALPTTACGGAGPAASATDTNHDCCFSSTTAGRYTVTLSISDTYTSNKTSATATSTTVPFVVEFRDNTPACLQRTEPGIYDRRIFLSRSPDLGGSYQSRTFTVDSVADDCQPYPDTSPLQAPAQLVWSIDDGPPGAPHWVYQATRANSFLISQSMFPNARPGDTVRLRVEARDDQAQRDYQQNASYGAQICPGDLETCCDSTGGVCGSSSATCVRWTTWTVQFQP